MSSSHLVKLFSTLNSLLSMCSKSGIQIASLPKIIVVGLQSAGKSSVVEAIVQHNFLPCGGGMVTKCPLVLHLKQDPSKDYDWGEFQHCPGEEFQDFKGIQAEIKKQTKVLVGENVVSEKFINLTIHSPNIVDLLLVDLPGVVAVDDDNGKTTKAIDDMVNKFMKDESNIMLTVSDGSADIATSRILGMAKRIDPQMKRTINVITKMDLKSPTGDAIKTLRNDDEKSGTYLRYGHVGLMCRGKENKEQPNTLEEEAAFFNEHKEFLEVRENCGIEALCWKLQNILLARLQDVLPKLKSQIDLQMKANDVELLKYGRSAEKTKEPTVRFYEIITAFCDAYSGLIQGTGAFNSATTYAMAAASASSSASASPSPSLSSRSSSTSSSSSSSSSSRIAKQVRRVGGAKIRDILSRDFADSMDKLDCIVEMSDNEIVVENDNLKGMDDSPFPEKNLLIKLCHDQIAGMTRPCEEAVENTHIECCTMVKDALTSVPRLGCLPRLMRCLETEALELLEGFKGRMMEEVNVLLESQRTYPTFSVVVRDMPKEKEALDQTRTKPQNLSSLSGYYSASPMISSTVPGSVISSVLTLSTEEKIRKTVEELFNKVRHTVKNSVPQLVMLRLVKGSMQSFRSELGHKVQEKYTSNFKNLLEEDPSVTAKRSRCLELKKELEVAWRNMQSISLLSADTGAAGAGAGGGTGAGCGTGVAAAGVSASVSGSASMKPSSFTYF